MSNDNSSGAGLFILLGLLGVGIFLATRGGNKSSSYQHSQATSPAVGWEKVQPSQVLYENEERWELIRGPDRLIEEIVIHRKVTQNG